MWLMLQAWATAMWFWKQNMHNVVQGGEFGRATNAINGGQERNPCRLACPTRFTYYGRIMRAFGQNEGLNSNGC